MNYCHPIYHYYHTLCFQNLIVQLSPELKIEELKSTQCFDPKCVSIINEQLMEKLIIMKKREIQDHKAAEQLMIEYQKTKDEQIKKAREFTCTICFAQGDIQEICVTLNCDHRICKSCLALTIKAQMDALNYNFICAQCPKHIGTPILQALAREFQFYDTYENYYENLLLQLPVKEGEMVARCTGYQQQIDGVLHLFVQPDICRRLRLGLLNHLSDKDKEKMAQGDMIECKFTVTRKIIDKNITSYYKCNRCQNTFCTLGCSDPHIGQTCAQFEQWQRDNAQNDKEMQDYFKAQGFQNCGSCGIAVQKLSGCDRITCFQCQQSFCWQCPHRFWATAAQCYAHMANGHK